MFLSHAQAPKASNQRSGGMFQIFPTTHGATWSATLSRCAAPLREHSAAKLQDLQPSLGGTMISCNRAKRGPLTFNVTGKIKTMSATAGFVQFLV